MSEMQTSALLILNPNSRMGGEADIQEGIDLLEQAGFKVIKVESDSPEKTARLIDQHQQQVQLIIIGGGDGTISSAAPSLYQHQITFAILPLGTANDLARSLGMTNNLLDAFHNIINNKPRRINLGVVNEHYFFNVANIGLGVQVTHELTPEVKKKWGVLSYLKAVFVAFKNNRKFRVSVMIDGEPHRLNSIHLAIGNGRYYGGGNVIDEASTIGDGQLYLYSLPPLKLWKLLALAPLLRTGKQRNSSRAFVARGQRIEISTTSPKEIHADGEPVCKTPATFKVIPEALSVICPELAGS